MRHRLVQRLIAQVHRARLKLEEEVVIKVQRKGIYETMARDIGLMHKLVSLVPPISITGHGGF